jgi:hypothetical protein
MEKIEFKLFMLMLATVMSFSLGAMDDESYPSECEFENSIEISGWPNLSYCQYDDEYVSESLDNSYEREMSLGRDTVKVNVNSENKCAKQSCAHLTGENPVIKGGVRSIM